MKICLVLLLVAVKSGLGSSSNWYKKVYQDSNDSMDMSEGSDTEDPDDPEDTTWGNVQGSKELSSEDRNEAAESYSNDKSSRKTGFASKNKNSSSKSDGRLSRLDCRRRPESKREWLIGSAFLLLCGYFGPRVRDEIVSALESEVVLGRREEERKDVGGTGGYDFGRTYAKAFEIQKPALARCFESAHDYYYYYYYYPNSSAGGTSSSIHRYPACLRQLAINPRPDFQILWLKNYPHVLRYIDRAMKSQRIFQRARVIVQELLNHGVMDWWPRLESLKWAKSKVIAWKSSKYGDSSRALREILQEHPRLFDICKLSEISLHQSQNFKTNDCLRKIIGNLLVLESIVQEDGATLEMEFLGGNILALNLLHAVKSVLKDERAVKNLRTFDNRKTFLMSILSSYRSSKFLTAVIRSILADGVLEDDLSNYPWAREFLTKWKSSMIENLNVGLEKIFYSIEGGFLGKPCPSLTRNYKEVNSKCWRNNIAEIIIVESELIKNGLSLQLISFDDPFLTYLVHLIDRVLQESNEAINVNEKPQFRRALTPNARTNQISQILKPGELADLLTDSPDEMKNKDLISTATSAEDAEIRSQRDREVLAREVVNMLDIQLLLDIIDGAPYVDSDIPVNE